MSESNLSSSINNNCNGEVASRLTDGLVCSSRSYRGINGLFQNVLSWSFKKRIWLLLPPEQSWWWLVSLHRGLSRKSIYLHVACPVWCRGEMLLVQCGLMFWSGEKSATGTMPKYIEYLLSYLHYKKRVLTLRSSSAGGLFLFSPWDHSITSRKHMSK